jgi:serine/threonine protein kinase
MTSLVGQQFESYRIDGVIGDGGMGTVYRATDVNLMRPVAVKVMHGDLAANPAFQQRFQQEARAAARLDHPSIVRVYYFGRQQALIYIVMELVEGLSLGAYLRQLARLNQIVRLDETLTLIAQVADALGYAHRQGVVHRDIKPDNILVKRLERPDRPADPPLRAMVTDFGLAKLLEGEMDTQVGQMVGTLPYMSPEQVLDLPVDGRSDIYSLGVILYQLATSRLPFEITTPQEAVNAHQYDELPAPRAIQPNLPLSVEQVILRALSRRPENRYQTGEELAQALRQSAATMGDQQAAVGAAATESASTIVSIITDLPTPVRRLVWDMRPRRLRDAGVARVLVRNNSPGPVTVAVMPEDPTRGLQFDATQKHVALVPGQTGIVDFYVRSGSRPLTGRTRKFPFRMHVAPIGTQFGAVDAQPLDAVVEARPQIPLWLTLLLVLLLLALCGLLAWAATLLAG